MENNQDDLVVAVAGYKDRMDKFFSYIPGMMSRIGNHIDFPNYTADELVKIAAPFDPESWKRTIDSLYLYANECLSWSHSS